MNIAIGGMLNTNRQVIFYNHSPICIYIIKEAAEARPSLHMSKCHIVGNLMHRLK